MPDLLDEGSSNNFGRRHHESILHFELRDIRLQQVVLDRALLLLLLLLLLLECDRPATSGGDPECDRLLLSPTSQGTVPQDTYD